MSDDPATVQEASSSSLLSTARQQHLRAKMAALFAICGDRCHCRPESCLYREGRFGRPTQSPCPQVATCAVCRVFSRQVDHLLGVLGQASASKGALFSQLLASSMSVHHLYDFAVPPELPPDQRVARKKEVKELLCAMLDCHRNRLQCLRRIGELGMLLPQLLRVQLASGRSLFWEQLRKVANTVRGQVGREARLTVLAAIRGRLPHGSPWKAILTPPATSS